MSGQQQNTQSTCLTPGKLDEVRALVNVEDYQQVPDGWAYHHQTGLCHLAQTVLEGQEEGSMALLVAYSLAQN